MKVIIHKCFIFHIVERGLTKKLVDKNFYWLWSLSPRVYTVEIRKNNIKNRKIYILGKKLIYNGEKEMIKRHLAGD